MWPPPNIQALPSKEEILQIKEEISSIEMQLMDVQLKMKALQKSIAERKAWIAPIRKLTHDVLSQIFVEVSMGDWTSPLTLQSVSRWWRDVVVGSPRAWTFIPLFQYYNSDLVSLFIERSRNVGLHISATDDLFSPQIKILASRIECLNLEMTSYSPIYFIPSEYDFTRLERLHLHADSRYLNPSDGIIDISNWDMMHLPNLKSLELAIWDHLLLAIASSPQFPSIRRLQVECDDPSPLTDILVKCAKSLESIDLYYCALPSNSPDITPTIHFPFLRYMQLGDTASEAEAHWRINGSTPNLEGYRDIGDWPTIEHFKVDFCNVTFLSVLRAPDLSLYPRLVTLCVEESEESLIAAIDSLRGCPQYSPDLAVIEYDEYIPGEVLEEITTALLALTEETGRQVKLEQIDWLKREENEVDQGWVPRPCSEHMPCHSPDF